MDLHSKLTKGMDDMAKMFQERMDHFDRALAQQPGLNTTGTANTTLDISSLAADYAAFKSMVYKNFEMLRQQLQLITLCFDKLETSSRRKVLLIHGVPEDNSEQLDTKISSILVNQLNLSSINISCVDICHRLGVKKDKPRPILARFTCLKYRNAVWKSKTALKGSGITISEFLTKPRQAIFIAARNHFGISSCWTADGIILVALPDKSRAKLVSMSDLDLLIAQYPPAQAKEQKTTRSRRIPKTLAK